MTLIRDKSIVKNETAQFLINNKYYTESVHCSYYYVLLYMKYILCNLKDEKSRITYEQQDNPKGKEGKFHKYILDKISFLVDNPRNKRYINEEFQYLKQQRKLSDYDSKVFNDRESLDIKEKSEALIRRLKDSFETIQK